MSNRTKSIIWLALAVTYAIATFYLSSLSNGTFRWMRNYLRFRVDLYIHAVEYGILTWLLLCYLNASGWLRRSEYAPWFPLVICAVIGGANELWQAHVPGRSPAVIDEIANIAGSLVVITAWLIFKRRKSIKP